MERKLWLGSVLLIAMAAMGLSGCKQNLEAEVTCIEVTSFPSKVSYYQGETPDLTGMTITARYSDGSTSDVTDQVTTNISEMVTKLGNQSVTVKFNEFTASFVIFVKEIEINHLSITSPDKTVYFLGEEPELDGFKVMIVSNDGIEIDVTDQITTDFSKLVTKPGNQKVTVTYRKVMDVTEDGIHKTVTTKDYSSRFDISVLVYDHLQVTSPDKVLYLLGDSLKTAGLKVMAVSDNGTEVDVTSRVTCDSDEAMSKAGKNNAVKVSCSVGGMTREADFKITVKGPTYVMHETVTSAGTKTLNSKEYSLVYFGDWPKTVMPKDYEITLAETPLSNGYYVGSDGNLWEKHQTHIYGTDDLYKLSDGTLPSDGEYRYFKVEPIVWRVLTKDYNKTKNSLLLAEECLVGGIPYYITDENREISGKTVYPNDYKYSTARAYLNGSYESKDTQTKTYEGNGFLQKAFSASAQALILETTVDNSLKSTGDVQNNYALCGNTTDKVFLLSCEEAKNTDYGFSAEKADRIHLITDYAKSDGAYLTARVGNAGYWWLRSPSINTANTERYVYDDGYISTEDIKDTLSCIVPALTVSLN